MLLFAAGAAAGELDGRVPAALERHGLGAEALLIPDNLIRHEIDEPRGVPPLARELLARPLAAADAAAIFDKSVPESIRQFRRLPAPPQSADFEALLARFIEEVSLDSLARLVTGLRAPGLELPPPQRRETPIGPVVIGGPGPDTHVLPAALIIDPGGDDSYVGAGLTQEGFSAIIDLAGNDRYAVEGLAAARNGIALVLDMQGNDEYRAGVFALGAGAGRHAIGALIDLAGNDRYQVRSQGQGYGAEGGLGLLWDAGGDDEYVATGEADYWQREGALSFAQGVAAGQRSTVAGGIGILRDEAGDDRYEAQMFAQGAGYYFGLGLLWDGGGADRYRAVRYAQGAGIHQAIGVLRDESGNDDYAIGGVGQGTGHDMALGLLLDASGDDAYAARYAAQGAGLANGIGLLADLAGSDRWQTPADRHAEAARGLPSIGVIFERVARFAPRREPAAPPACPPAGAAAALQAPFIESLRAVGRDLAAGTANPAYDSVVRAIAQDPAAAIAKVSPQDFSALWALGLVLPCAAALDEAMESAFERILAEDPASPYAAAILNAVRNRPSTGLRPKFEQHPSCAVRAQALRAWPEENRARKALASPCWREQAAALGAFPNLERSKLARFLQQDSP